VLRVSRACVYSMHAAVVIRRCLLPNHPRNSATRNSNKQRSGHIQQFEFCFHQPLSTYKSTKHHFLFVWSFGFPYWLRADCCLQVQLFIVYHHFSFFTSWYSMPLVCTNECLPLPLTTVTVCHHNHLHQSLYHYHLHWAESPSLIPC
jgi:hypothetical protein